MCWRERITICCFLTMPIHDHDRQLGTGGVFRWGQIDLGRWRNWSFTTWQGYHPEQVQLECMKQVAMRATKSEV